MENDPRGVFGPEPNAPSPPINVSSLLRCLSVLVFFVLLFGVGYWVYHGISTIQAEDAKHPYTLTPAEIARLTCKALREKPLAELTRDDLDTIEMCKTIGQW